MRHLICVTGAVFQWDIRIRGPEEVHCDPHVMVRANLADFLFSQTLMSRYLLFSFKKTPNFAFLADRFNSMFRPFVSGSVPLRVFVFDVVNTLLIGDGFLT